MAISAGDIIRLLGNVTTIVEPWGILFAVLNGIVSEVSWLNSLFDCSIYYISMLPASEFLIIRSSVLRFTK